ncbi:hypothetical protein, partial [Mycobacteroides abscessus]
MDADTAAVRLFDGTGEGVFEVVQKLFDDGIVSGNYDSGQGDPVTQRAFEVKCVTDESSRTSSNHFEYVPAVD